MINVKRKPLLSLMVCLTAPLDANRITFSLPQIGLKRRYCTYRRVFDLDV